MFLIVDITRCRWPNRPTEAVSRMLTRATEGFAGADLQALCAAGVVAAFRRRAPRLLDRIEDLAARPAMGIITELSDNYQTVRTLGKLEVILVLAVGNRTALQGSTEHTVSTAGVG